MLVAASTLLLALVPPDRGQLTRIDGPRVRSTPQVLCSAQGDRDLRASLENSFAQSTEGPAKVPTVEGELLRDLPLWRVQWTALPGHVQFLHVHVPQNCDMFESLVFGAGGAAADVASSVSFGADGKVTMYFPWDYTTGDFPK